jgi:hypothetical protein
MEINLLKILIIFFLLFFTTTAFTQTTFQKTYGGTSNERGNMVHQTSDGGYMVFGETVSLGNANWSVYLVRTDSLGNLIWTKTYSNVTPMWITHGQQTYDGGYIISGIVHDTEIVSTWDIYLIKTDANGDTLWTRTLQAGESYSVIQTTDSGYIIAGSSSNFMPGDFYLIKISSGGNVIWWKGYGGNSYDFGIAVKETYDEGFIISGNTTSFGAGARDFYLIKTDANGDILWSRTFGGASWENEGYVQQTLDSGYIITGGTLSFGSGVTNVYLIKIDSSGNIMWSDAVETPLIQSEGYTVQQTEDSGFIVCAGMHDTLEKILVIKTSVNGDTLWTRIFGDFQYSLLGSSIKQTMDKGFIMSGSCMNINLSDILLIKMDSNGNSSCNGYNLPIIVSHPSSQITTPATLSYNHNPIIVNRPPTINSVGIESNICLTDNNSELNSTKLLFKIYPNPFSIQATLTFSIEQKNSSVIITDIYGNKIKEIIFSGVQLAIGKEELKTGIYFVQANDKKSIYTLKLIVQ